MALLAVPKLMKTMQLNELLISKSRHIYKHVCFGSLLSGAFRCVCKCVGTAANLLRS